MHRPAASRRRAKTIRRGGPMEFDWSDGDAAYRRELRAFLDAGLPGNWQETSVHGPGSDAQAAFSREFCGALAERGWLTQSWPRAYGGADATPWRHAILSEEMWRVGEPRGSQYMNVNWIGPTIMKYGSEAQKVLDRKSTRLNSSHLGIS